MVLPCARSSATLGKFHSRPYSAPGKVGNKKLPSNCVQYDKNAEGRLLCIDVMKDLLDEDALALYKVTEHPLSQYPLPQ